MAIDLAFVILAGDRRNRDHLVTQPERCGETESIFVDVGPQQKCRTSATAARFRRFKYSAWNASLSQCVRAAQTGKAAPNNGDFPHVVAFAARILSRSALLTRRSVSDGTVALIQTRPRLNP